MTVPPATVAALALSSTPDPDVASGRHPIHERAQREGALHAKARARRRPAVCAAAAAAAAADDIAAAASARPGAPWSDAGRARAACASASEDAER